MDYIWYIAKNQWWFVAILPHGIADVKRSLSVNKNVGIVDIPELGERTINAVRTVKDIVNFCDPIHNRPHKILVNRLEKEKQKRIKEKEEKKSA